MATERRRGLTIAAWLLVAACRGEPVPPQAGGSGEPRDDARGNEEIERLAALPYAAWIAAGDANQRGVTRRLAERMAPGINLYNPRTAFEAELIDATGRVLHRWTAAGDGEGWHHVEPLPDGGLLGLERGRGLDRLDWESRRLWRFDGPVHHDVAVADDGTLYVPLSRRLDFEVRDRVVHALVEEIAHLDAGGRELSRRPLWPLFRDRVPPRRLAAARRWWAERERQRAIGAPLPPFEESPADLFHLNSIEVVRQDFGEHARRGDLLLGLRELDLVAVVDAELTTVRWAWGDGELDRPHHPSLLPDGRVLVFDNGLHRGSSRVVEIDPAAGRIVWQYPGVGDPPFFSHSRGAVQRLANGNTLITESNRGRVFEIDPGGELVWEFFCPDVRRVGDPPIEQRSAIYRMRRLEVDELRGWGLDDRLRASR
jgi:hypothetical protein